MEKPSMSSEQSGSEAILRHLRGYEHAIGGVAGGFFSTIVCHPMDLLKIRYSANEGNASIRPQYRSYYDAARQIVRANGIIGLYQGLSPNLLGGVLSWGLYLQFYNKIKRPVGSYFGNLSTPATNFICGVLAGSVVMCFTNPIWVAKTRYRLFLIKLSFSRLCLQYEQNGPKKYTGMMHCLHRMYREEGFRSLYRGFLPGLFGTTHGAVQFMIYDYLKDVRCASLNMPQNAKLSVTDYFLFSALSKIIAVTVTYPYQVVRTRMQDHNIVSRGVVDTITVAFRTEGIGAFYKGLLIANVRTLPATIVTLITYEQVNHFIKNG